MKVKISSYYNIRFFKPYMIPLSTTGGDPAWYHNFKGQEHYFKDKNGVINGLREECLHYPKSNFEKLDEPCQKNCPYRNKAPNCQFMTEYLKHLRSLNFEDVYKELQRTSNEVKRALKFTEEPIIILIVYESKDCICAERPCLIKWFKENGVEVTEWEETK